MLKKAAILLLCLLYSVSVYGIVVNVNYCGSQPEPVKASSFSNSCPMCHAAAKMKCCKTSHVQVKVKDAHLVNSSWYFSKVFAVQIAKRNNNDFLSTWQQAHSERILYHGQHAPPPDKDLILIKNCTFRI